MSHNLLVTGAPGSGKTTVVERTVDLLAEAGYAAGGVYCPEVRDDGERVGFEIRDAATGESRILAHVDRETGPAVGKYRVAVGNVDAVASAAIERSLDDADVVVVDEIAPMEAESDAFCRWVRRALDAAVPVVAAVHRRSGSGFVGEVKAREDVALFEVTPETRDDLPRGASRTGARGSGVTGSGGDLFGGGRRVRRREDRRPGRRCRSCCSAVTTVCTPATRG